MLRIEQGFDPSSFQTNDSGLNNYVGHHRLVAPALSSPDLYSSEIGSLNIAERYTRVVKGLRRSATLALVLDDLSNAPRDHDWNTVRSFLGSSINQVSDDWRIRHEYESGHHQYSRFNIWTAKRTLAQIDENVRIRERYTVAGDKNLPDAEYQALIENGVSKHDMVIAVASVYVVNKTVKKPSLESMTQIDWKNFPNLDKIRSESR